MAINDVSLTAGMRSNLLNLQNTVTLLERTQSRLSSGNKVNTAIDNPTSFFASQALNSRAATIDSLKDAMGQAIQTVQAADKGIKAITSMIEQAKGIAQQALSATSGNGFATETITLNSITQGQNLVIETNTLTAGPTAVVTTYTGFNMALGNVAAGNTVQVGGVTFTASTGSSGTDFDASGAAGADAIALQGRIAAYFGAGLGSAVNGTNVTISAGTMGLSSTTVQNPVGGTITITSTTSTAAGPLGANEFAWTGNDATDAQALANLINNNAALIALNYSATASNGVITLEKAGANITTGNVTGTLSMVETPIAATTTAELTTLQNQYNELRTQMSAVATDSGYKGKNLLAAGTVLTVQFEGNTLSVNGFAASASGLLIDEATWTTGGTSAIDDSVTALDDALTTLRSNSSALAGNLSVITVRQDFSTNMINTLTEGANKLTLADANEEGANMLMLQTRQSLSTTALSLSAQAAQSVLRLFQ